MFLSRRYRPNLWPFYGLLVLEFCLTVGLLTLTGIAAPNLYRTKLWQDGADNGFNSSPVAGLYAAANYRPYTTPKVWSQFTTNYNLVVAVLSMFIMLVKGTLFGLHVLPPIISTIIHAIEIILYSVAVAYQASSDATDPRYPQHGPAWFITKDCSVTRDKSLVGYCQQAKATFACFVTMLGIFVIYFGISLFSCFPSKAQKEEYEAKRREKKMRWAHLDEPEPRPADSEVPASPAFNPAMNPMTPRTVAFNKLGGTKDLRLNDSEKPPRVVKPTRFALRSPGILRSSMHFGHKKEHGQGLSVNEQSVSPAPAQMVFPPPPRESSKKG